MRRLKKVAAILTTPGRYECTKVKRGKALWPTAHVLACGPIASSAVLGRKHRQISSFMPLSFHVLVLSFLRAFVTDPRRKVSRLRSSILVSLLTWNVVTAAIEVPTDIEWSWGPVAPVGKSSRATTVVGCDVVTVGGTRWEQVDDGGKIKQWLSAVYKLDTKTMQWHSLPSYPNPAGYAIAVTVGTRVFVVGGRGEKRGNTETFVMDMSVTGPKWLAGPELPDPRWAHAGGVIDGVIYVIGGFAGDPVREGGPRVVADVLAHDTAKPDSGWMKVAKLPNPQIEWPLATACGDKIYLFAGFESLPNAGSVPLLTEYALDVNSGQWRKIRSLPERIYPGAATAIGDRHILLCGGLGLAARALTTPDGKPRTYIANECFLYDIRRDHYMVMRPLKQAVLDQGLVHVDGRIISTGGEESPHRSRTDLVQVGQWR